MHSLNGPPNFISRPPAFSTVAVTKEHLVSIVTESVMEGEAGRPPLSCLERQITRGGATNAA